MTDPHAEAWSHIQPHLYGSVLEVTRQTPWGFKQDYPSIENVSIETYLSRPFRVCTIILHILVGEGESFVTFHKCLTKARDECLKIIILEHDPEHWGFPYSIQFFYPGPHSRYENWGRNFLFAFTTFEILTLPQLSDSYVAQHLPYAFISKSDEGIDKTHLVYTHTSEHPLNFELPDGIIYWTIGGGLCLESMRQQNTNILFDISLKQCLYLSMRLGEEMWKLKRIWPTIDTVTPASDYKQWRTVKWNGVYPDRIIHCPIQKLEAQDSTIYTSTIDPQHYKHLRPDNNIIEAFTERDVNQLHLRYDLAQYEPEIS